MLTTEQRVVERTIRWATEQKLIQALPGEQFRGEITDVRPLAGGVFSRAFAFTLDLRAYVIRLSTFEHSPEGFAKDDHAWRHFASPALPIPRVVATGQTADGYFAISERVPGRTLDEL